MVELPPLSPAPAAPAPAPRPAYRAYFFLVLVALWIGLVTAGAHALAWFIDQSVLIISDRALPAWSWLLVAGGHGVLLILPLAPLARFVRAPRPRAIYQTWALATLFVFVLSPMRLFPAMWKQAAALAQVGLSLAATVALLALAWRRKQKLGWHGGALCLALALVPLIVFPSLEWGALGSALDMALNLLAGLSLGLFAGVLCAMVLIQPLRAAPAPGDYLLGGLAAGVTFLILGAGFGFGGSQLLLMVCLPPLGFAAMGVSRLAGANAEDAPRAWPAVATLVGLVAAAPLMFVDPNELTLILEGNEILNWAFKAAGASMLLAVGVGVGLRLLPRPRSEKTFFGLSLGALGLTWVLALAFYLVAGKPGFYGDRLFVILKDQADVSSAVSIADRTERLRYVYTTLTSHANQTQADLRLRLDRLHIAYRPYYLVNALEVDGGPLVRAYLSTRPEVGRILASPHLRPLPEPLAVNKGSEPAPASPQWNITSIGADRVWKDFGVTGQGIVVGQSDTGVDGQHEVLRDSYRGYTGSAADTDDYNWLDPWNQTKAPTDIGGHGTHTLGSILGGNGIGVAPGAKWMACVNLARNLGNPAVYLNCMQFMLAPYPQAGDPFKDGNPALAAHVMNNSWGCPPVEGCDANVLAPAVEALRAAGIFVVASAGNAGYAGCSTVNDPLALYGSVFTVGAVDAGGNLAPFSSRGPVTADGSGRLKPDIAAPGMGVLSSTPGNTYATYDGTSMAGPHVVGVVALMWSANPRLVGNIDLTAQILRQTARPYTGVINAHGGCDDGPLPNDGVGYGLVDAYAAVKAAREVK